MSEYIKRLIAEGENQFLDFKFEVSDFRKIARTLVAFSNTDGGRLLVGVKDNGAISGVRSEEEYYMVDGAARMYCRPEVKLQVREWQVEGKKVVEVIIERGKDKPYLAQDNEGHWVAYIRQGDQNFVAGKVMLQVWERTKSGLSTTVRFREPQRALLSYLEEHPGITVSKYRRIAGLTALQAERDLVDFIMLGLLEIRHTSAASVFSLTPGYQGIMKKLESRLL